MASQLTERTYVFIDGEYLRQRHREVMRDFFGVDGELELSPIMQQARASRAYFYDAIDYARLPEETDEAWEARIILLERYFSYIRSLDGFHVRPGSVRRGKKREQKEVDVSLAVDMMEHGFNGSMSKAVLIAGDVDFRPVVEALVRHGVFVDVWYHRNSFAQELPGAADFGHEIRFRDLYSWSTGAFQRAHRIPDEERRGGQRFGQLVKTGSMAGVCQVELYKTQIGDGKTRFDLWIATGQQEAMLSHIMVSDKDADLIGHYAAVQYAPIVWELGEHELREMAERADAGEKK